MNQQDDKDKDEQATQPAEQIPNDSNPSISSENYTVRFYIEDPTGDVYRAEALSSTLVGDIASDFFEERGWPTRDSGGRPQRAVVERVDPDDPDKTSRLAPGQPLEDFIRDDDTIRVVPESVEGGGILTGFEQSFLISHISVTNEQYQALSALYTNLNDEITRQKEYIYFIEKRIKEIEQRFDNITSKLGDPLGSSATTKQVNIEKKAMSIAKLRSGLTYSYSESEIKGLCLDLDIDYEVVAGQDKNEKIIELISYCKRYGLIVKLYKLCQEQRPNVDWEE